MSMIRVDYSNARAQAKKLDSAVAECETTIQRLNTVLTKVPACWEGDSASVFLVATQKRIQEVNKIRDRAEQIAALIRRVADEFEEAERRMKEALAASATGSLASSTLSNGDGSGGGFSSGAGFGGGGSSGSGIR